MRGAGLIFKLNSKKNITMTNGKKYQLVLQPLILM